MNDLGRTADRLPVICIATVMRGTGETGVQTHFNGFLRFLEGRQNRAMCITPFSAQGILVYPVFGLRRLIDPVSGPFSVWWYRYWHGRFLQNALARALRRQKGPVVIYAQCPISAGAALRARQSRDQRVVMAVHFSVSQADEWAYKGRIRTGSYLSRRIRRFEELVLQQLDGIVYVSQFARQTLESRIPALESVSSSVIPNFTDAPITNGARQAIGDLVNVGTLDALKNQAYLLEILGAAARMGHRYTLTLIGDGPGKPSLERLAQRLGIRSQVRFLGFRPDAASLIAEHRLYCHVSRIETFPIVLLESMARGIPIVSSAVGGTPEVFQTGVEGLFWPLDAPDEAARILIRCMDNEAQLAAMGFAGRRRVSKCFSTDVVCPRLLEFLSGSIDGPIQDGSTVA